MSEPTLRWTPAEASLMLEAARRSLVASLDGGGLIRVSEDAPFRMHVSATADPGACAIELAITAERATVALAESDIRWRNGWMLELVRGDERWLISAQTPSIEIAHAGRGPFAVHLRLQHLATQRELAGAVESIHVTDVACYRYTRQSSAPAIDVPPTTWAKPTLPERAPWWELDLAKPMLVGWLRVDLARPPPGTRVIVRAYGFLLPSGAPPKGNAIVDLAVEALGTDDDRVFVVAGEGVVARYLRVELAGETDTVLEVTAAEVLACEVCEGSLEATLRRSFAMFRDRPLFVEREGDAFVPRATYGQVWERAMTLAAGLAGLLEERTRTTRITLGIMLRSRPEWVMADLAALVRAYVSVPLSPDDADDRLGQVLSRARPTCVICEPADVPRVVRLAMSAGEAPLVIGGDALAAVFADGETRAPPPPVSRAPDELHSVLFTSGSTGTPKGAMRSFAGFFAMVKAHVVGHSPQHLSFQPLSHLSERMYLPALLAHGGTIAFSRGGAHLMEELRAFAPTTLGTVPRLFEVLYATYQRRLKALLAAEPQTPRGVHEATALAEARRAFGDRLFAISVGSAPVSAEVLAFLKRCFDDIWVSEGYGSTEVGTIASDGKVVDDVQVKLVPLPGTATSERERGEIYVRSPHAITGYLGDPDGTRAAFDADGFFATGDLGERDRDGRVRVVGRVRNTVKLAQGEFVSAERIETALATAPVVDRIFVHAEHGAIGVAALVVPRHEVLAQLLAEVGELAELVAGPRAAGVVLGALRVRARAAGLAPYEVPRGVLLEASPLTVEAGLLTGSGKLARGALSARYGARLAALAAGGVTAVEIADPEVDDLRARVARIAGRVLGRTVALDEALAGGVGVDSLAAAEILAALSDELGREVPLAWWFEARTFADLATRLGQFAGAERPLAKLAADDLALPAISPVRAPAPGSITRVLLTGATGFLGAHLVEALTARGIAVTCLVRAPDDAAAHERLAGALAAREIDAGEVAALAGDLGDPALASRLDSLSVDTILHAGATVSWLASYPTLRAANVLGTHALLAFAAARGLPFHHVSTISTAPATGDEDTRLSFDDAVASTPYALSKWIAEEHVRRAGAAGLPVAIYRPAMIAGHSRRGIGNADDFLNRYLRGCADLGLYIDRDDGIVDMTPVDFVAQAITSLALARPADGAVYHLANIEGSLAFSALGRALVAAGLPVRPATYSEFRAALARARTSRLHALGAFFPEPFTLGMGPWPRARTAATLAELGVACPTIDGAIIARYVARLAC